jgi:hypothetical protein
MYNKKLFSFVFGLLFFFSSIFVLPQTSSASIQVTNVGQTFVTITVSGFTPQGAGVRFQVIETDTLALNQTYESTSGFAGITEVTLNGLTPNVRYTVEVGYLDPNTTFIPTEFVDFTTFEISPKITKVTTGSVGETITINGFDLIGVSQILFGNISATTITNTPTLITVTVPTGAKTGIITVKTAFGNVSSNFTLTNTGEVITITNKTNNSADIALTGLVSLSTAYSIEVKDSGGLIVFTNPMLTVDSAGTAHLTVNGLNAESQYQIKLYLDSSNVASSTFNTLITGTSDTTVPPGEDGTNTVEFSGLAPKCNTKVNQTTGVFDDPCDFNVVVATINRIIEYLLVYLATPLFALILVYAGWLYLSDMGSSENKTKAKKILINAVIGFVVALAAWLIVKTILTSLGFIGNTYLA